MLSIVITGNLGKLGLGAVHTVELRLTFTKAKLTTEDGIKVYDVEFRTTDTEYEYEINAKTGKIIEFSSESIDDED